MFRKNNRILFLFMFIILLLVLVLGMMTHSIQLQQNLISIPIESNGIKSIEITHYGEGGSEKRVVTARDEIESLYFYWSKIKIGNKTEKRCDDDTTIYKFLYQNGMIFTIEKECNNYINEGKSYEIIEPDD